MDCPFRKNSSTHLSLSEGRIEEIVESMYKDEAFPCHKTTQDDSKPTLLCKGSLLYMERDQVQNQVMQVGQRLKSYDGRLATPTDGLIDIFPNINKGWYSKDDKTDCE